MRWVVAASQPHHTDAGSGFQRGEIFVPISEGLVVDEITALAW